MSPDPWGSDRRGVKAMRGGPVRRISRTGAAAPGLFRDFDDLRLSARLLQDLQQPLTTEPPARDCSCPKQLTRANPASIKGYGIASGTSPSRSGSTIKNG